MVRASSGRFGGGGGNILRAELEQAAEEIQAAHTENQAAVAETKAAEANLMSRAQPRGC